MNHTTADLDQHPLALLGLILGMLFIYFLPGFNASRRHHRNAGAIWVLNLFLGWIVIGWIVSLVWSFISQREVVAFPVHDTKYPMNDAILRRVDELQAHENRKNKTVTKVILDGVALGLFCIFLLWLISQAHAESVCGRYVGGAHQNAISALRPVIGLSDVLLGDQDAHTRIKRGSCVCAYGKVKDETFVKLKLFEKISERWCAERSL